MTTWCLTTFSCPLHFIQAFPETEKIFSKPIHSEITALACNSLITVTRNSSLLIIKGNYISFYTEIKLLLKVWKCNFYYFLSSIAELLADNINSVLKYR